MAGKTINSQDAVNQLLAISAKQNTLTTNKAKFSPDANASLNPATQNILGQYGLNQQSLQDQVKQNITINNETSNIINNNIKVPSGIGGPVQGRPIQFQDPNQIKFKSWLNNSFTQQNEMSEKRKREYIKRDSELTRSSNKLMRKLEETSKSIATSLNPKNMASSIGNQFKTLLLVLGFGYIAKSWPKLLDRVNNIETTVKTKVSEFFGADGGLSQALGGKPGETGLDSFKNLFIDPKDGIFAYIGTWIDDKLAERQEGLSRIKKPSLSWDYYMSTPDNVQRIFSETTGYLSDILMVLLSPEAASKNKIEKSIIKKSKSETSNPKANNGKGKKYKYFNNIEYETGDVLKNWVGDAGFNKKIYRKVSGLREQDLKGDYRLANNTVASWNQSVSIARAIKDSSDIRISGNNELTDQIISVIIAGLNRLEKTRGNTIDVSKEFVESLVKNKEEIEKLGLNTVKYNIVYRPLTQEEKELYSSGDSEMESAAREAEGVQNYPQVEYDAFGAPASTSDQIYNQSVGNPNSYLNPTRQEMSVLRGGNGVLKTDYISEVRPIDEPIDEKTELKLGEVEGYRITKDQLQEITNRFTQNESKIDFTDKDFSQSVYGAVLKSGGEKLYKDMSPIEIGRSHKYSEHEHELLDIIEKNKEKRKELFKNSRLGQSISYLQDKTSGIFGGKPSRFSDRESGKYYTSDGRSINWSDIRINKNDKKTVNAGTGAVGKDNINKEFLTQTLIDEIGGVYGRQEGLFNAIYINPDDNHLGGHSNYGFGNTYATVKNSYKGPVSIKSPDGKIHKFNNIVEADEYVKQYRDENDIASLAPFGAPFLVPENKRLYLTKESADAINKAVLTGSIKKALEMDHEILGAMDKQTLGGLLHVAYGGPARYDKLISFYNSHKKEALEDLQSNNGVHTEDFINRVMMNTEEGSNAMHTAFNNHHWDRRGFLTGYQTFNYYTDDEWNKHIEINSSSTPQNKKESSNKNNKPGEKNTSDSNNTTSSNSTEEKPLTAYNNIVPFNTVSDFTPDATFTPQSNIENSIYNTKINKDINYTASLTTIDTYLKNIKNLIKIDSETDAHVLEAVYDKINATSSINLNSGQNYTCAVNYTDIKYNHNNQIS